MGLRSCVLGEKEERKVIKEIAFYSDGGRGEEGEESLLGWKGGGEVGKGEKRREGGFGPFFSVTRISPKMEIHLISGNGFFFIRQPPTAYRRREKETKFNRSSSKVRAARFVASAATDSRGRCADGRRRRRRPRGIRTRESGSGTYTSRVRRARRRMRGRRRGCIVC